MRISHFFPLFPFYKRFSLAMQGKRKYNASRTVHTNTEKSQKLSTLSDQNHSCSHACAAYACVSLYTYVCIYRLISCAYACAGIARKNKQSIVLTIKDTRIGEYFPFSSFNLCMKSTSYSQKNQLSIFSLNSVKEEAKSFALAAVFIYFVPVPLFAQKLEHFVLRRTFY